MHRILFTLNLPYIGPLDIYTYGVMMVLAFIFALTWALKFTKPEDIEPETVLDLSIYVLIGGIVGARLLFVLMNYQQFTDDFWSIFNLRKGGLAWYGSIIVGIIAGIIFSRKHKISFWKLADMFAPPIIIGLAIGRIGCFFNGCCYGRFTDLPWGVVFPEVYPFGEPRHPTQIYSSILNIIIFYILNLIDRRKKYYGQTFCYLIGLYGISRCAMEFLRDWINVTILPGGINLAQVTSIVLIIISIIVARKLSVTHKISDIDKKDKKYENDEQDDDDETSENIGTELKEFMQKSQPSEDNNDREDNDLHDEIM